MTSDDCKQLHRKEGKQMPRTYVEEKKLSNLIEYMLGRNVSRQ